MTENSREQQISGEAKSPEASHRGDSIFSRTIARAGESVKNREQCETRGPSDVDDRGVANRQMNQPPHKHCGDHNEGAIQREVNGLLDDHAASGTETSLRRATRRSNGARLKYKTIPAMGANK